MLQAIPLRRLALAFFALALALAGVLAPGGIADAAHDRNGEPVDGVQQAYNGARAEGGGVGDVTPDLFFHGNQSAEGHPTFNEESPTGSEPQMQQTDPAADPTVPGDPASAYWLGEYTGTLDGAMNLRWFWSTINPTSAVIRVDATVTVFADPDMESGAAQPDKIIGRQNVAFSVSPDNPLLPPEERAREQEEITAVPVDGEVTNNVLIQVVPVYTDTGPLLTTTYDSQDFPGGFEVQPAGEAPTTPASKEAEYDGEPFRVQAVNVPRDAAEPTIGVNKDGTAFYAAGAFDAAPENPITNFARTEVLRSRDGGLTWESIQPQAPADVTTIPPTTLDPYVYVEEESGRMFNPELYVGCSYMQFSDDEGETWQTNPAACGEFVNDHHTIFAGPPPPNLEDQVSEEFPEVLYYCFNRVVDSNCGRSLDGGRTFDPALGDNGVGTAFIGYDPAAGGLCGGLHGHVATDSEGRLFLPKGHCGYPWIGISEDGAETWKRVQISDTIGAAATHLSVAVDAADNLFFVWWDTAEHLPYLATSTNHGETWSEPLMIAPPGVHEVNFPVIYAGAEGRIAINFPGTTVDNQDDKNRPWNQYIVASTNALADNPLFVSTTANPVDDPIHRGDCLQRCAGMFDFLDVIISPHDGDIWATATDTCTNDPANEPEDEATNCVDSEEAGNGPNGAGVANDEEGLAIRQLSGPKMLAGVQDSDEERDPDPDLGAPVPAPDVDDDDDRAPVLPATGGGLGLLLIGAMAMPLAVFLVRRRR